MITYLFEKEVDQSLLKSGLTVPTYCHDDLQKAIGITLAKGEKATIAILIDGERFEATLSNVNFNEKYSNRIVFQIRYSESSPICKKLNELFSNSDDGLKQYIDIYVISDKTLEFRPKTVKYINWTDFYCEFADKLLSYKDNREELLRKLQNVYTEIDMPFPTLEQDGHAIDVDPFTVYGLFSRSLSQAKKNRIIHALKKEFSVAANVPTTYDGIPVVNPLKANFFYFKEDREENDIDNLWKVFETALALADGPNEETRNSFINLYDKVRLQKGVKWNLTMGLFWIRPNYFINLDSKNRGYLSYSKNIGEVVSIKINKLKDLPSGEEYLTICDLCKEAIRSGDYPYKSLPELSIYAWKSSSKDNSDENIEPVEIGKAIADQDVKTTHYWIYSPGEGSSFWEEFYKKGIMGIGWDEIGDLTQYPTKEEMKAAMKELIDPNRPYTMAAHATWQSMHDMNPGDVVFVKRGMYEIIGKGIVTSDYYFDPTRKKYKNIRNVNWTHNGKWPHPGQAVMKTLTDITPYTDYIEKLNALFENDTVDDIERQEIEYPPYSPEKFLEDVYMDEKSYETLVGLVRKKKNVILQGAPGVGKTFAAKRLAYSMMGEKDPNRVMMIQFHQSYSYEDFIMGFRPSGNGFELKRGAFYNFCKAAEIDSDNEYFFIIDEINRGNLSKIFGELFMLIENDKRGIELQLLYSDEKFSVPANVYIIGMMNTADRSLAMLDYALRRRFAFFDLKPGFSSDGFRAYRNDLDSAKFDNLIRCIENLNAVIAADESLGSGFCIGHSYFCNLKTVTDQALRGIVEYEIIPLLKEYWFDEPMKVEDWSANLRNAIK